MVKPKFTEEDDALLAELGIEVEAKKVAARTPREERIIAGFEEIERFVDEHGRPPAHGESNDIFERLYAVRLDKIRGSAECREVLQGLDSKGLSKGEPVLTDDVPDDMDDEALLAELGVEAENETDITKLKHVRTRAEIKAAEEIAQRTPCTDFAEFKPLFEAVQHDLDEGIRKTKRFRKEAGFAKADIKQGHFIIIGGQTAYIAKIGDTIKAPNGEDDARLRVIYSNGTESDILLRSLIRAMYKDESSRLISEPNAGPLFSDEAGDEDVESGTIYVLRSNSDDPYIKENRDVIHKIGVTGGDVKKRFGNAKSDPTFLMADVEVVATYKLSNINRVKLEKLIHRFFESAKLNIEIKDRFGKPIAPREWFLVPLFVIDEAVEKVKEGTVINYRYDPSKIKIIGHKAAD
jgi:hypothetical protein